MPVVMRQNYGPAVKSTACTLSSTQSSSAITVIHVALPSALVGLAFRLFSHTSKPSSPNICVHRLNPSRIGKLSLGPPFWCISNFGELQL